jgi:hypothetical protein
MHMQPLLFVYRHGSFSLSILLQHVIACGSEARPTSRMADLRMADLRGDGPWTAFYPG